MDIEGIMLSEISETKKDKYCMISFMWNLKEQKITKSERSDLWLPGAKGGRRGNWKKMVKRYKLPVIG